jgi:hypothetical protein
MLSVSAMTHLPHSLDKGQHPALGRWRVMLGVTLSQIQIIAFRAAVTSDLFTLKGHLSHRSYRQPPKLKICQESIADVIAVQTADNCCTLCQFWKRRFLSPLLAAQLRGIP